MPDRIYNQQRYVEVRPGEYAPEVSAITAAKALTELWTNAVNLAASGVGAWSAWLDLTSYDSLRIGRTLTAGAHRFDVEWSRDGVVGDFVEAVTVADKTTVEKAVGARFARFRVANTDAVNAQTGHRTNVFGR